MEDAIVVGAGIIGCSLAWRLAQRGWRLTVFDAGRVGGEASWAGAGMLAPGGEVLGSGPWAELALESLRSYPSFVGELQEESGCPIDFQQNGAVEVAADFEEWTALLARAKVQKAAGIPSESLDERARERMVPLGSTGVAGLFYPEDAVVNPRDVVGALKTACLGRGIRFRENEPVVSISAGDATAAVTTAAGTWEADAVILAAGAWSSSIKVSTKGVDVALPRSYPVRGHLLGYQLRPGMLTPILRHGHTYLLQRSSGFLVAGTTSEEAGFDRTVDPSAAADIERRATRLLPCLAGAGAPAAWIGFRPGAAEPVSGRAPGARALWLSYGHYRNGILLAPACAARLAAAISASAETGLPSISGNP